MEFLLRFISIIHDQRTHIQYVGTNGTIQIYGINGLWQISKQFIKLPRAGSVPRADGQIDVYLHVRTPIQELSQYDLRSVQLVTQDTQDTQDTWTIRFIHPLHQSFSIICLIRQIQQSIHSFQTLYL
ncbi:MAG: hypothetical protein EZS28_039791 [Streblomastix strix]|uniref:Uncharacterized protein n=1 Tax=Streblomastix strix TaxID=222440 RepID=A0A5J4U418_9EUKA|nr:MAG: hypothetical protein EZS28_039791 [Streblomastix strix]